MVCGCLNVNLPAVTLGRNLRGPQLQKRRQRDKQDNERQTTDWAWKAAWLLSFRDTESWIMPACKAAWAIDHQDIAGYGHFEADTGRVGRGGPLFEDGSDALANGSVRPALFPRTIQPSACGQLEGRLGTQNDRRHLAGTFHPSSGPLGPQPHLTADPRLWRPSLRLSLLSQFKYFRGIFRALHNSYSPLPPWSSCFPAMVTN